MNQMRCLCCCCCCNCFAVVAVASALEHVTTGHLKLVFQNNKTCDKFDNRKIIFIF